jgi:hypothetical protein
MPTDSSKQRRRKRKLEPITFEELYSTSNMSGFVSFLQMKPGETVALPHLAAGAAESWSEQETGAPEMSAPIITASITRAPSMSAPVSISEPLQQVSANETGAPDMSAPVSSAPAIEPPGSTPADTHPLRRPPRLREAYTVQDGHSHGEQALYDAMYRNGRPYQGDEIKILTIGYRTLAERSRMAYSNCKLNVRSLIEKLAIEPLGDFSYTEGTTFLVYGYREVLRRRRAAGLTHIIRQRGVSFIDPATGRELTGRNKGRLSAPVLSAPVWLEPDEMSAPETIKVSAPETVKTSAPVSGAHLDNIYRQEERQTTTDERRLVLQALSRYLTTVDDDAVDRLITACRERAQDATVEDIAHFIAAKAQQVLRSPEVRNPLGLLQVAIPKCFEGESFRLYREAQSERNQQLTATQNAARTEWLSILEDPNADEEAKRIARHALGVPPTEGGA